MTSLELDISINSVVNAVELFFSIMPQQFMYIVAACWVVPDHRFINERRRAMQGCTRDCLRCFPCEIAVENR